MTEKNSNISVVSIVSEGHTPGVLEAIEQAKVFAEDNDLDGLAIVMTAKNGNLYRAYANGSPIFALRGLLADLGTQITFVEVLNDNE